MAVRVYNEGAAAFQAGNEELALERFQSALALDPQLVEAHAALATILYRRESYAEAQAAVDHLLTLDPPNVQGRRVRFLIFDALADNTRAAAALDAYAEVDPAGAAGVLYQRADMDFSAGDVAKAKAALERVLQLAPDLPRAHYTLGLCYASSGDTAQARQHLQKFIALAPEDPEAETAREMLASL
jgi:tetratricopeptide (TPR) repeat protein